MNPRLRSAWECLVLAVLAVLPAVIAGCAAAPAAETRVARHAPQAAATGAAPPAASAHGYSGVGVRPTALLPSFDDELWVIVKPPPQPDLSRRSEQAGPDVGGPLVTRARDGRLVAIPLRHTDVKAAVSGYVATVDVAQRFHNPYAGRIEAVYVFPLPHNAAVTDFVMTIGERRIRGIIRERQEAEQIYREARGQGHVASLLTEERPNVFTQSVANIEPGKQIDVYVRYFNTLTYSDGWYEFAFPMVVGPRFNPPGRGDGIGAAARENHGAAGQKTEVQYLRPGERGAHGVALSVRLDAGVPVEQIESRNHKVAVTRHSPRRADVTLDATDGVPDRDFVLRWKVAGNGVKSGLLVHLDERDGNRGGYFSLMLVPPADLRKLPRSPLEMVFTLDVSGSMDGRPIEQAKAAIRYALSRMGPDDTFQLVRFAGHADTFAPHPIPATPDNVRLAQHYLDGTSAGSGTMMLPGIRRSLEFPAEESRPRCVTFLTDGYIGNEAEILGALHRSLRGSRVFGFGVGSAPNRYLLEHMARLGDGAAAYLGPNDRAEDVMAAYFNRISHPALTNLSIDWGGADVSDVYPRRTPDLFVGRPVIFTGRFTGEPPATVKVTGHVRGERHTLQVAAAPEDATPGAEKALPQLWARMKIADLADRSAYEPTADLPAQVRRLALDYGLMSAYTAFVAVDSLTRTQGTHGTTVATPVPVPAGVRYETTVEE